MKYIGCVLIFHLLNLSKDKRKYIAKNIEIYYSKLKEDSWGYFENDMWYLIYDFEKTCDKALKNYPLY